MPNRSKVLTVVAFCAFPLALGAAILLLWQVNASAQLKYDRIAQDMNLEAVKQLLGDPGSKHHPGDTKGKYRFDSKKAYREVANPRTDETWWYWRFDDGLIIAAFDSNGMIIWKQFFRRT